MSVLIRFSDIVLNTMAIVYHQEGRRIIDTGRSFRSFYKWVI